MKKNIAIDEDTYKTLKEIVNQYESENMVSNDSHGISEKIDEMKFELQLLRCESYEAITYIKSLKQTISEIKEDLTSDEDFFHF